MKKRIFSFAAVVMLTLTMVACGGDENKESVEETKQNVETVAETESVAEQLIGRWTGYAGDSLEEFEFLEDGTMTIKEDNFEAVGEYTIAGNQMVVKHVSGDTFNEVVAELKLEGDTLEMTIDDETATLTRDTK